MYRDSQCNWAFKRAHNSDRHRYRVCKYHRCSHLWNHYTSWWLEKRVKKRNIWLNRGTTGTSTLKPAMWLNQPSHHFMVKCLERSRNCLDITLAQCRKRDETLFLCTYVMSQRREVFVYFRKNTIKPANDPAELKSKTMATTAKDPLL